MEYSLLDIMPFGKHRGELIIDIEKEYLGWCVDKVEGFELKNKSYQRECLEVYRESKKKEIINYPSEFIMV